MNFERTIVEIIEMMKEYSLEPYRPGHLSSRLKYIAPHSLCHDVFPVDILKDAGQSCCGNLPNARQD